MKLSKFIRKIRLKFNCSQASLGKRLKVCQSTISGWERGRTSLSIDNVTALGKFCKIHEIEFNPEELL